MTFLRQTRDIGVKFPLPHRRPAPFGTRFPDIAYLQYGEMNHHTSALWKLFPRAIAFLQYRKMNYSSMNYSSRNYSSYDDPDAPPPDPFRGVFDLDPWAASRRDPATGKIPYPMGPPWMAKRLPDGSYELRQQIAHRLSMWLTYMRSRAGFNQTDIAEKLGTTQAAVAKWETSRTLISLDRLAEFGYATKTDIALYFDMGGYYGRRAMWL